MEKYDESPFHRYTTEYIESEISRLVIKKKELVLKRQTLDLQNFKKYRVTTKSLPNEEENEVKKQLHKFQNLKSKRNIKKRAEEARAIPSPKEEKIPSKKRKVKSRID